MFAIVSYKGNQYKVSQGQEVEVAFTEELESDKEIEITEVLLVDDGKSVKVGTPLLEGASVKAIVLGTTRGEKVTGIKFKPKKHYQRNLGHKQDYTKIRILSINA